MLLNLHLNYKYALAFIIIGSLIIGITVLYTLVQWQNDWQLIHQTLPKENIKPVQNNAIILEQLPAYHLFGKSLSNLGKVPLSNLQLRVVGIVKLEGEQAAPSKAYISVAGQSGKIYRVGDFITEDVKVYDITPYAVILENAGHLEKLPLVRKKLHFKIKNAELTQNE